MLSESQDKATSLTESFAYQNSTHKYIVKWCSIGDPANPPLLFVHGTPWSSRVWASLAIPLARRFHVYLFDRPGFGESARESKLPSTPDPYDDPVVEYDGNLARQAEVFSELFKSWQSQWRGQRPHVVAHDNAGLVTLRAHLLHGCEYASLCLMDVVAIGPFGQPLFKSIAEHVDIFRQLPDVAVEGILESYIRDAAFHQLSKETMQTLKEPWLREGGKDGFLAQLCQANARSTDAVEEQYGRIGSKLPIKIIWGADDKWLPVEVAYRLGAALKVKEVVVVPEAGHLIMCDQPAAVGIELASWLSSSAIRNT